MAVAVVGVDLDLVVVLMSVAAVIPVVVNPVIAVAVVVLPWIRRILRVVVRRRARLGRPVLAHGMTIAIRGWAGPGSFTREAHGRD